MREFTRWFVAGLAALSAGTGLAGPAPFDLAGPTLEARVTRGAATLPIGEVPSLAAGDRLWIKADLPETQSAQYLMVVAFLRGSTNPPPSNWFYRCETWAGKCAQHGLTVTVPADAQQVLVFLAPRTGGDFNTLVGAVRARPGIFVRASQDLNQAMLDRSRLRVYLADLDALRLADSEQLKQAATLMARSLAIKVNEKCLDRIPALQAPCLMDGDESLIMNDGHSTSIVEALTAGPANDLAMEASYTPQLGYGYYSPYLASMLDIARLLGSFTTAQYQYIPALALPQSERLALSLNAAPSFQNPKSVLVVALPAVEGPQLPPLHAVDPQQLYCARRNSLVLPVEGAPLVFSTAYAHDLKLRLAGDDGQSIELPAVADAAQGGFLVTTAGVSGAALGDRVHGSLHGSWGFEPYDGPKFQLVNTRSEDWRLPDQERSALIVGRENTIHLQAVSVSCVDQIMLRDPAGKEFKPEWKSVQPGEVELKLPLQDAQPGPLTLLVGQYGEAGPEPIALQAFAEAAHIDGFTLHSGDATGLLQGTRLDEVASLNVRGIVFAPGPLSVNHGGDALLMIAQDPQAAAALPQGVTGGAQVRLKDGRALEARATVDAPRPSVALISASVQLPASARDGNVQLGDPAELPQDARLVFSVRAREPASFAYDERIEVATTDESATTTLSLAAGSITLERSTVAVAVLDPAVAFGRSVFGPLKFRVTLAGSIGDWQPIATLVRLPVLTDLRCPSTPELACKLSGANLFLIDSLSADDDFSHPVPVPDGFPGNTLPIPQPTDGHLFLRLRDDPAVVNPVNVQVVALPPSPEELARAEQRHAAATRTPPQVPPPVPPPALAADATASASAPAPEAATPPTSAPPASVSASLHPPIDVPR
jgi:hypothetical protein